MKKFLSFLAILATIFGISSVSLAKSFSDVEDTKYEEAVNVLTELEIVKGYEDNTYKPNNTVKRSEMAKLLIVAMGKENSADALTGTTSFSDVSSKHWAAGYINLASSLGLIKGYPDGSFKPDATVSYVEASTMLLRALDYGKELDSLSWPKGYMSKANDAGLLENVTANNSSEAAIRGNIASMVLNTLKANTRKVVASNNTGNVYGAGEILIEKAFSDLVYVKEGLVTDIDLENKELEIKDEKNDRKLNVSYTKSDIKKMFGRQLNFIYDKENDDFLSFEIIDELTVKTIDVYDIDEDEKIIIDEDDNEYDIPKSSNVLFFGSERYADIDKAYLTMDKNKKVKYVAFEGEETVYAGIVVDNSITIDGDKGIKIINTSDKYEELVLASTSTKIYNDDIVLYTYNNDDEIVIKALEEVEDAIEIESVTSSSIKLEKETKLSFSSSSDYVVLLTDGEYIEKGKLSSVDSQYDLATIVKYGGVHYIIVFIDSVDVDDIETSVSVSQARKALNTALSSAKKKKEASYSVVSFERLKEAIAYGEKVYAASTSYSSAKIQLATKDINDAVAALKKVTTDDKELRVAYAALLTAIEEAEALDSRDYTTESYKDLSTALTAAKKIKLISTTVPKVTEAKNKITSAVNLLVTNLSAEQIVEALTRLDEAIKEAKSKRATDYTAKTYDALSDALKAAEKVDRTIAGYLELNNVAKNLEAAIIALMPVQLELYINDKEQLDKNMKTALEENELAYTLDSWKIFSEKMSTIKNEYEELKEYEDVKALNSENMKIETDKVKELNKNIESALTVLVLRREDTLRKNSLNTIKNCIDKAETYTSEEAWNAINPAILWSALQEKITYAKAVINNPNDYTTEELKQLANELFSVIPLV